MNHKIFFLIGASGAGKTTAAKELEKAGADVQICYFDSIGVPSPEEMEREYGSGDEWQRVKTLEWVKKIKEEYLSEKDVVLDAQTRPSFIEEACQEAGIEAYQVVLFDCSDEVRRERLNGRGQPELATEQMMNWGRYLRDECQEGKCLIVNTSDLSIEKYAETLSVAMGKTMENQEGKEWTVR